MMNNNAFEVDPSPRKKRKRSVQCSNVFTNPALDILSTEDRMCNNIMEVAPAKRTKRSKSCDTHISFENPALEFGNNKNDLLRKELANVNRKLASILEIKSPIYQNNSFNHIAIEEKTAKRLKFDTMTNAQVNSTPVISQGPTLKRRASFDLSFIDKIAVNDSTNGEALYLDDDLNESNIMEIKTIDEKKLINTPVVLKSTNPFLNCQLDYDAMENPAPLNDFPFDFPVNKIDDNKESSQDNAETSESSYNASSEPEVTSLDNAETFVVPRRLFREEITDNSIQYMDDSSISYDVAKFGHSTLNEPINTNFTRDVTKNTSVFVFGSDRLNKQSKILGCDVSQMSQGDIFNCKTNNVNSQSVSVPNVNNNIQVTFKDNSQRSNFKNYSKLKNSKNIFSKIKDVFKHDKKNVTKMDVSIGNPYEVFRKAPIQEKSKKSLPVCFINPALNLNNTDSEMDETVNSNSNYRNLTPMKKSEQIYYDKENLYLSGVDLSDAAQMDNNTIKKHVRFDSTLNHEKYITGNSFDSENHSVGSSSSSHHITQVLHHIDDQIEEYHTELENCFNEKKIISQNI